MKLLGYQMVLVGILKYQKKETYIVIIWWFKWKFESRVS